MTEMYRSWAEIDLSAIRHNATTIRSVIDPASEILAVVKANAYGHGALEVARALTDLVDSFGVACLSEAVQIGLLGRDVLLLGPCLPAERAAAVEADFVVTVSSAAEAEAYAAIGPCRINFKIDTGMGRIGCWHEEAVCNLERIRKLPNITVHSLSTHLPSADEDAHFTKHQLDLFASLQNQVHQIFPSAKIHTRNSAGIFGFPSRPGEVVRAGLALYGSASPEDHQHRLLPALTWKARIILVRDIPAGRTISYGRTFVSKHPMRVASVSAGYADGFPRQASGRGAQVLVQGQRCAVLGRVTMDQIVIDVSKLQNVTLGEEVVFVGRQGHEEITANELARHADTISWHLFTGISPRVQRVYI